MIVLVKKFNPNSKGVVRFSTTTTRTFHCRLQLSNVILVVPWVRLRSPFAALRTVPVDQMADWRFNKSWSSVLTRLTGKAVSVLVWTGMEFELVFTDSGTVIPCSLTPIVLSERLMDKTPSGICSGTDRLFDKLDAFPYLLESLLSFGWYLSRCCRSEEDVSCSCKKKKRNISKTITHLIFPPIPHKYSMQN